MTNGNSDFFQEYSEIQGTDKHRGIGNYPTINVLKSNAMLEIPIVIILTDS